MTVTFNPPHIHGFITSFFEVHFICSLFNQVKFNSKEIDQNIENVKKNLLKVLIKLIRTFFKSSN